MFSKNIVIILHSFFFLHGLLFSSQIDDFSVVCRNNAELAHVEEGVRRQLVTLKRIYGPSSCFIPKNFVTFCLKNSLESRLRFENQRLLHSINEKKREIDAIVMNSLLPDD